MNAVFASVELVLPRTDPLPWVHAIWVLLFLALYFALAYLTFATQHFFVYSFFDSSRIGRGSIVKWVFVVAAMTVAIFLAVKSVIWIRRLVTESFLGISRKSSPRNETGVRSGDVEARSATPEAEKMDSESCKSSAIEEIA